MAHASLRVRASKAGELLDTLPLAELLQGTIALAQAAGCGCRQGSFAAAATCCASREGVITRLTPRSARSCAGCWASSTSPGCPASCPGSPGTGASAAGADTRR